MTTETERASARPPSRKAKVAVLHTKPETALQDYARLMELADFRQHLDPSATTIIKDNISWHFPFPSANTTPWQLEGSIVALRQAGYNDLTCVQNKTVVTDAFKGEDLNHFSPVFKHHDVPVLFNFRSQDMRWEEYRPKRRMLALDKIYPGGIKIPDYFPGKNIVHLPTAKCHIYTTTTGAMKNAFGGLLNTNRHYTHTHIHETLVDLLAIQKEIHTGIFALMDGTTAGNGPGPRIMEPVRKDVILASGDQVAIDAVAAKLMGFDPLSIPYIGIAHQEGLGTGDPHEIEVVGDDISNESWGFKVGSSAHSFMAWLAWYGPTRVFQWVLHTPLVHFANFWSEAYHDYYHWPLKERKVYERWLEESPWGQLFATYADEGAQAPSTAPVATA
ncbi:MAG: DUF362 domain-containing protein [Dehalococcoidia bacterium]|nr:DUF362 domain-containing protein [Dehalococcoidia bacterium]